MASDGKEEYEVGRCKPPRDTRFKKGQSGNPKGRPRGSGNLHTLLFRQLKKKVVIVVDGKRKKITKLEAAMCQLANEAATGKLRNIQLLLQMFSSMEKAQKMVSRDAPKLTEMPREQFSREVLRILIEAGEIRYDDYAENAPSRTDNAPMRAGANSTPPEVKS